MSQKTGLNPEHKTDKVNKLPYSSPELRMYGDVYERTNTNLPFSFTDVFVLTGKTT